MPCGPAGVLQGKRACRQRPSMFRCGGRYILLLRDTNRNSACIHQAQPRTLPYKSMTWEEGGRQACAVRQMAWMLHRNTQGLSR